MAPDTAAPVAHGGGADQSRSGWRGASSGSAGGMEASSAGVSDEGGIPHPAYRSLIVGAAGVAAAAAGSACPAPARVCAASRRAQSWKIGQTGNADERQ